MKDPDAVIELAGVTKKFGEITALDEINLQLVEGEFFALLGPSGCGKTTLLRLIAGFERPDAGSVVLDGEDITAVRPSKRPVNMMFQSYALFPHMSVRSNIAYGLEMDRIGKSAIDTRVNAILHTTGLTETADRRPDQLSGGQRQRVALARALVKQPRVLLLDEPLAALDRKLRGQMQLELKRLQHELGITFVVVTHDQDEAMAMADRIAVMDSGSIVQSGTPQSLYENPQSRFVAAFIGDTNFLSGRYANGQFLTQQHGTLGVDAGAALADDGNAQIAIRPEHLSLSRQRPSSELNAVKGRVVDKLFGGDSVKVIVAVNEAEQDWIVRIGVEAFDEAASVVSGDDVWCNWSPSAACLLAK